MPKSHPSNRGWWRDLFHDHPKLAIRHPDALLPGSKSKAYCKLCFDRDITTLLNEDEREVSNNQRASVRSREQLELELWSRESSSSSRGWLRSASITLLHHLRNCDLQSNQIKDLAATDHISRGGASPSKRRRHLNSSILPDLSSSTSSLMSAPNSHLLAPSIAGSSGDIGLASFSGFTHSGLNTPAMSISPLDSPSITSSLSLNDQDVLQFPSDSPMLNISPHMLLPPQTSLSTRHPSRSTSRSTSRSHSVISTDLTNHWSGDKQRRFEYRLTRLTASAGLPLSWVDNPEWIDFCEDFIPAAKSPSRKTLTRRLLPSAVAEFRAEAKAVAKGHEATMQADGWTGTNNHHLIAIMITVDKQVRTVRVHDASAERKTAENLVDLLESVLGELRDEWGVSVIAIVTDASGETRKARRLLGKKYQWLVVLDCYAHQINLVVGDYFKSDADILKYTDKATNVIAWLRSKTFLLALLRAAQEQATGNSKAVIRAVLTRWTAHYMAYKRLLELQPSLFSVIYADDARPENQKQIITGDSKSKAKARQMISIIKDPLFWHALTRVKHHLEPLAVAANITQASFCRLDQVLLTFGFLIMQYKNMPDPEDDKAEAITLSIEKRWKKADQELFIAAVILNPFFRTTPFAPLPFLNNAGVHALLGGLWTRFYSQSPPPEFHGQLTEYLGGTGFFRNLHMQCGIVKVAADRANESPDPLRVYGDFCFAGRDPPPFILLARRILSICANSASCERLFSIFGTTLTKLRNRLGTNTLNALSELKMHIRDENLRKQTGKRLKRAFATQNTSYAAAAASALSANALPTNTMSTHTTTAFTSNPNLYSPLVDTDTGREVPASESMSNKGLELETQFTQRTGFRAIVDNHTKMADDDDTDGEPVCAPGIIGHLVSVEELFDFGQLHWVELYAKSPRRSFDEELELYELLDLDAQGEDDVDLNVDDSTGAILHG